MNWKLGDIFRSTINTSGGPWRIERITEKRIELICLPYPEVGVSPFVRDDGGDWRRGSVSLGSTVRLASAQDWLRWTDSFRLLEAIEEGKVADLGCEALS